MSDSNIKSPAPSALGVAPQSQSDLWDQPNKFARPPGIKLGKTIEIHGYQEFKIKNGKVSPLSTDDLLQRKIQLAGQYLRSEFLIGKTLLDIGANGGFFSFLACQRGASQVVSLDMDEDYLNLIRTAQAHLGWPQISPVNCRVQDWDKPADVVLAFAMVHWLYSCTANFGSLDAVVTKLASLTRLVLIIEWVAPNDPAILGFKHTEWNPDQAKGPYSREAFESALRAHFYKVEIIGATSTTRVLYAAYRQANEVSLHAALPLLDSAEHVISSRCLAANREVAIYCRVYTTRKPDQLIKQATGDLAMHEGKMLNLVRGAHFPRVIATEQRNGYSLLTMERIIGSGLVASIHEVASTPGSLAKFINECLVILRELQDAAIEHRDIRMENIIVRNHLPVLIDFGWAHMKGIPYGDPSLLAELGGLERIPTGAPCDVYSMGKVLQQLIPRKSALFSPLLDQMLDPKLARQLSLSGLVEELARLKLPDRWDVPMEFPIALQRTAAGENGTYVPPLNRPAFFTRTWRRWKKSIYKRLPLYKRPE